MVLWGTQLLPKLETSTHWLSFFLWMFEHDARYSVSFCYVTFYKKIDFFARETVGAIWIFWLPTHFHPFITIKPLSASRVSSFSKIAFKYIRSCILLFCGSHALPYKFSYLWCLINSSETKIWYRKGPTLNCLMDARMKFLFIFTTHQQHRNPNLTSWWSRIALFDRCVHLWCLCTGSRPWCMRWTTNTATLCGGTDVQVSSDHCDVLNCNVFILLSLNYQLVTLPCNEFDFTLNELADWLYDNFPRRTLTIVKRIIHNWVSLVRFALKCEEYGYSKT